MVETVDQMIADIIRREGGYVDHPADSGGPTQYGITQAVALKHGYPDVRLITQSIAHDIMFADYFQAPGLYRLPAEVQAEMFDIAVNSGGYEAVIILQHALLLIHDDGMRIDGVLGQETVKAVQAAIQETSWQRLEDALVDARLQFYRALAQRSPSQQAFLNGWEKRAESFEVPLPTT